MKVECRVNVWVLVRMWGDGDGCVAAMMFVVAMIAKTMAMLGEGGRGGVAQDFRRGGRALARDWKSDCSTFSVGEE
jgi:hypothetical protein